MACYRMADEPIHPTHTGWEWVAGIGRGCGPPWGSRPEPHLRLDALDPIDRNVARAIGYVADQAAASESEGTR